MPPEEWMRNYFRNARSISRLTDQILDEASPPRTSLYGMYQDWRSRLSTPDFSVVRGKVFLRQPPAPNEGLRTLLELFEFTARHGLELSRETERWAEEATSHIDPSALEPGAVWASLKKILLAAHGAATLRTMHRLGLLDALFPEFRAIDSLVIRDYFHRYTVDAHSLLAIENLARLSKSAEGVSGFAWERQFFSIYQELDHPELLLVAVLFHDVGKGIAPGDHVRGSLHALDCICERVSVGEEEKEVLVFLIQSHLEMSVTLQRRDIFDPNVVRTFSEKVGTTERLKMLTLLTFADIKSVNPEALTLWKAELIWQLFTASMNYLTRSLDHERFHVGDDERVTPRVHSLLVKVENDARLGAFLEGFPRRYLLTHSPEEIAKHFEMYEHLEKQSVGLRLRDLGHLFELTVTTRDRSFLFATIAGALTAWGMNILKADAYANSAGVVLDTFRFADLYRTIELNPTERDRFLESLRNALTGQSSLENMLHSRLDFPAASRPKVRVATQVHFEEPPAFHEGPPRASLLEVITQDRPGLLYQLSSTLAELGLNIDVALIDTEGQRAIDVFYLTFQGAPLDAVQQEMVCEELLRKLQE